MHKTVSTMHSCSAWQKLNQFHFFHPTSLTNALILDYISTIQDLLPAVIQTYPLPNQSQHNITLVHRPIQTVLKTTCSKDPQLNTHTNIIPECPSRFLRLLQLEACGLGINYQNELAWYRTCSRLPHAVRNSSFLSTCLPRIALAKDAHLLRTWKKS